MTETSHPDIAGRPQPAPTKPSLRKTAYHHGNLRAALIEGGLALLEASGAASLSMRQLARHIAVSQAAPYHHFPDKNALLAALAAEGFRQRGRILRAASLKHPTLEWRIRSLVSGYVRFAQASPELFRLMYGPLIQNKNAYPELAEAATEAFDALAALMRDMITDFGIRHIDPLLATVSLLSLSHGLAHLIVDDRGSPTLASTVENDRAVVEHAAKMFVSGFNPRAAADPEPGRP